MRRAFGSAQISAMLEPPGLGSDGKRPDGITLFPWSKGRCLIWDFTCRDSLCYTNVIACAEKAGSAAEKGEKIKLAHHSELSGNYIVQPVANETLGPWGPMSIKFVKELGSRISAINGDKRSTCFLFQAISMAVQRGNIASIRGSVPNQKYLHELFYL